MRLLRRFPQFRVRAARCGQIPGDHSQGVTRYLEVLYIEPTTLYDGLGLSGPWPLAKHVLAPWQFTTYGDGLSAVT